MSVLYTSSWWGGTTATTSVVRVPPRHPSIPPPNHTIDWSVCPCRIAYAPVAMLFSNPFAVTAGQGVEYQSCTGRLVKRYDKTKADLLVSSLCNCGGFRIVVSSDGLCSLCRSCLDLLVRGDSDFFVCQKDPIVKRVICYRKYHLDIAFRVVFGVVVFGVFA